MVKSKKKIGSMARYLSIILIIAYSYTMHAQVNLTVALSADTIGMLDAIQISYTLEGARERIEIQNFDGIQIMQGPNISSSMSYVNGTISEKYVESYIIQPLEAGEFYLPSASVVINGEPLETEPMKLVVLPYDHYVQDKKKSNK